MLLINAEHYQLLVAVARLSFKKSVIFVRLRWERCLETGVLTRKVQHPPPILDYPTPRCKGHKVVQRDLKGSGWPMRFLFSLFCRRGRKRADRRFAGGCGGAVRWGQLGPGCSARGRKHPSPGRCSGTHSPQRGTRPLHAARRPIQLAQRAA